MTDDEQQEVDEAIETIRDAKRNEGPPWVGLRIPLYFIGSACLLLCLSVAILAALVLRADNLTEGDRARETCAEQFATESEEAAREVRFQTSTLVVTVGRHLLESHTDGGSASEVLRPVLDDLREANAADRAAVEAREAWVDNDRPLPCPAGE